MTVTSPATDNTTTTCPTWCELTDHADWADHIRIQHRANRAIPLAALPFSIPGQQQGHECLIVSLHAWDGSEPHVSIDLPESRRDAVMTFAEALELADAIGDLTGRGRLTVDGSAA